MATKNIAEVVIAGRILKITGYESPEYLHQIASYINEKIGSFEQMEGYRRQSADEKQIMVYMNLADDYFKSKQQADKQKAELEKKEKEMYSLKHDLIESQMARETLEKSAKEEIEQLKKQIWELEQKAARQETDSRNRNNKNSGSRNNSGSGNYRNNQSNQNNQNNQGKDSNQESNNSQGGNAH